jgi:hypothetical protein
MKQSLILITATLALSLTGLPQGKTGQTASPPSKKPSSLTGCLTKGSEGTFSLVSDKNNVKVTSSEELGPHAGHQVKLKGKWQKQPGSEGGTPGVVFAASEVDDISDNCEAAQDKK